MASVSSLLDQLLLHKLKSPESAGRLKPYLLRLLESNLTPSIPLSDGGAAITSALGNRIQASDIDRIKMKNKFALFYLFYALRDSSTSSSSSSSSSSSNSSSSSSSSSSNNKDIIATEAELIRATIFSFHGIESEYIVFDAREGAFVLAPGIAGVPDPTRNLMRRLSELGWLSAKLRGYLDARMADRQAGLVAQSFWGALQKELTEYYRVVAMLESRAGGNGQGSNDLTLRRLYVWSQEPLGKLRILCVLADAVDNAKGGALVSTLHRYSRHGDEQIQCVVGVLLSKAAAVVFGMMRQWLLEGCLVDPFGEFFIRADSNSSSASWQSKFSVKEEMLPSFISGDHARRILLIGKSIHFMRHSCNDNDWVGEVARAVAEINDLQLQQKPDAPGWEQQMCRGEYGLFEALLDRLARYANTLLVQIMDKQFHLSRHLSAIKRYLLLGQGDTIEILMDQLSADLDQPAAKILRNNLVGILDDALRASLAQHEDKDVLSRLDVRLLECSDGDTGWDIFSLDYRVEVPISAVFTPEVMATYLRLFNFLWRLKRMEFSLSATWSKQIALAHEWARFEDGKRGHPSPSSSSSSSLWRDDPYFALYLMRNEMHHLINNINYYVMFEVLEVAWQQLESDFKAASDLDQLVAAHAKYLNAVIDKALLGPDAASAALRGLLNELFVLVVRFHEIVNHTSTTQLQSLEAAERSAGAASVATAAAKSSFKSAVSAVNALPQSIRTNVMNIMREWSALLERFLSQLESQEHLHFLLLRLNFSASKRDRF